MGRMKDLMIDLMNEGDVDRARELSGLNEEEWRLFEEQFKKEGNV